MRRTIAVIAFLILLGLEVLIISLLGCISTLLICLASTILIQVIISLIFLRKNKSAYIIQTLVAGMQGSTGTILGITALIYFLIHIAWTGEALRDFFLNREIKMLIQFGFHLAFLPFPFLIESLLIREGAKQPANEDRKVLITGISLLSGSRLKKGKIDEIEKKFLTQINNADSWHNWQVDYPNRLAWKPIFQTIEYFSNLERIILLSSKETDWLLDAITEDDEFINCGIISQINRYFPKISGKVDIVHISDVQSIVTTYKEVTDFGLMTSSGKQKYEDHEIVFGITGSTATTSSALTMLAIKGKRGIAYIRQDSNMVETHDVDILTISELWNEMLDKIDLK